MADYAKWVTPRPCDWAGSDKVEVIGFDPAKAGFSPDGGAAPGEAYQLRTATGLFVWAPAADVQPLEPK